MASMDPIGFPGDRPSLLHRMRGVGKASGGTFPLGGSKRPMRRRTGEPGSTDLATVAGLAAGFLLLAAAVVFGGSVRAFLDLPAIAIVVGGTVAVTTVSFPLADILRVPSIVGNALVHRVRDAADAALQAVRLADLARRKGPIAIENSIQHLRHEPFLLRCLAAAVDGTPVEEVERVLARERNATILRHRSASEILRRAAEVAPAMGLIGTLVGLVQMLGALDNPAAIGPAMAVALLTTFYGAVLANMLFLPIAAKLERNSQDELIVRNIYILMAGSIGRKDNPRRLETALNSILPPAKRLDYFK